MNHKTILKMARPFKRVIGAHHRLIGTGCDADEYYEAQRKSDEAVATCKYLIQMLDDRHAAVLFARAVGMDGYINLR